MASKITLTVEPRGKFTQYLEHEPHTTLGDNPNKPSDTDNAIGKPIRRLPKELTIALNASGEDLHTMLADVSGTSVHRLRITKGSDRSVVPHSKSTTIEETGLRESSVIHIKDLGTLKSYLEYISMHWPRDTRANCCEQHLAIHRIVT